MTQQEFIKALGRDLNYWVFDDSFIVYRDKEIFEIETGESQYFDDWTTLMLYEHNGKTVSKYVEDLTDLSVHRSGGRGASGNRKTLFTSNRGGGPTESNPDLPARMNRLYNGNKMSQEHTISTFRSEHANAKTESMIAFDDNGFVSLYVHGGAGSVGFNPSDVAGKNTIHNHPPDGWANFSKGDLDSFARTQEKGMSATSSKATYTIVKTNRFDAKGFSKAVSTAKSSDSNYDRAVDRFLRQNSKKYGYTYTVTKH